MGYMRYVDPYYHPEAFGLTLVAEFELAEPCYSFDTFAIWYRQDTGSYYWANDSGCSCPAPFEDYSARSDGGGGLRVPEDREAVLSRFNEGCFEDLMVSIGEAIRESYSPDYARKDSLPALEKIISFQLLKN